MVVVDGVLGNWCIINKQICTLQKFLISEKVDPELLLSHYKFCKEVALYWINPKFYERDYDRLSSPPTSGTITAGTQSSRKPKTKT